VIVLYTTERAYPYGVLRSTHASKVEVVLEEKRLAYRVERLRPGDLWKKPPELRAKHPLGKVPFIDDGALTVYDSTVIDEYLDDAYPEPALRPADPGLRARMRMLENVGDEGMLATHVPLIWMPWWSPAEKRDAASMERGRAGLREQVLPLLESELVGRDYLCDTFSLADVPFMVLAMVLQVDGMATDAFANVTAYLDRLRARDSYRAIDPATPLDASQGRRV
jgi:glutathione S-transferase